MPQVKLDALPFFDALLGSALGATEQGRLVIWSPQTRKGSFHTSTVSACHGAMELSDEGHDVYFGLALMRAGLPPNRRGGVSDARVIGALWCDVDVRDPVHDKKNYPPDIDAACAMLAELMHPPSVTVHSGHGLQAYWMLTEPWVIEDPTEHRQAVLAVRTWDTWLHKRAAIHNWTIDSTGDLARVLRVPGTYNHKRDPHVEVIILDFPGTRYHIDDLLEEATLAGPTQSPATAPAVSSAGLRLDPAAEPPSAKLLALMANDRRFAKSWERSRADLSDQSPSAYDMSLATIAVSAGWTDQEIVDLLLAARRNHGEDPKLRPDYYQRTLTRARAAVDHDQVRTSDMDRIEELADAAIVAGIADADAPLPVDDAGEPVPPSAPIPKLTPEQRAEMIERLSKTLGVRIVRWIQRGYDPRRAEFSLVLPNGREVLIGRAPAVRNPNTFGHAVYAGAQIVLPRFTIKTWDKICKGLASIVEIDETKDIDRVWQVREWLMQYTRGELDFRDATWAGALENNDPFVRDKQLFVYIGSLMKFVKLSLYESVTKEEICFSLAALGFTRRTVGTRLGSRTITRSYWAGAEDLLETPDAAPIREGFGDDEEAPLKG